VTFAEIRDRRKIGDIEFYTKQPFTAEVIPGLEPKQRFDYPRKSFGGKGGGKGGRSDRGFGGDRGFGSQAKGWGNRGGDRFEGQSRGGDFRGNDFRGGERFEPRFDPRKDGGRQEPRFEARHDPRFEQGPQGAWQQQDPRRGNDRGFGRQDNRFQGDRPQGDRFGGERFERRDDRAPRSFDKPQHAPRAQARAGGNDRFDRAPRGPKLVGGGFKPHAPKRRG